LLPAGGHLAYRQSIGWIDGTDIQIDYRWASWQSTRWSSQHSSKEELLSKKEY
jgi:hypothetical protein